MSLAAKRSHRGDEYQLRIGLYWITHLLLEEEWDWVQMETISIPGQDDVVSVDDIVARHKDGSYRFIQAKKNQTNHRNWSITDLQDELRKACNQLEKEAKGKVILYSRTPFGPFGNYLEDSKDFETYSAFCVSAPKTLKDTLVQLAKVIARDEEQAFKLFTNVEIGSLHSFEDWERIINENIEKLYHKPDQALAYIERLLRQNQAGLSGPYKLTREHILSELHKNGLPVAPLKSETQIVSDFKSASQIGRKGISREIVGEKIDRLETKKILTALEKSKKKIIITGDPGCGKSCMLLDIADYLESLDQYGVLYIRGDLYDDVDSYEELINDRLQLCVDIVGLSARLSNYRKPIIILDSLDALALARDQKSLRIFLSLLDRLESFKYITVIVACRTFDLQYDPLLRDRKWDIEIHVANLDFDRNVSPILKKMGVNPNQIAKDYQELFSNPRNLKLFERIVNRVPLASLNTSYAFTDSFLEEVVRKNGYLGDVAYKALQDMANKLIERRSLFLMKDSFDGETLLVRTLESEGVIQQDQTGVRIGLIHQTLIDALTTKHALANGQTLETFILSNSPLPFIRPSIRSFLFYLRTYQPERFAFDIKKVLTNTDIAYHIKRLVVESLAEIRPTNDDLALFNWLLQNHPDHFRRFLEVLKGAVWFDLFQSNIFQEILENVTYESLKIHFIAKLREWMNVRPEEVIRMWNAFIGQDPKYIWEVGSALDKFEAWDAKGVYELIESCLSGNPEVSELFFIKALGKFVEKNDAGDELLWSLITSKVNKKEIDGYVLDNIEKGLQCSDYHFHDKDFLKKRLCCSDYLLSTAVESIEAWSAHHKYYTKEQFRDAFLNNTQWRFRHENHDTRRDGPLNNLLDAISHALQERSKNNDQWWQGNRDKLNCSLEQGLIYLIIQAYRKNVEDNIDSIEKLLKRKEVLSSSRISCELGKLLHDSFPLLAQPIQEEIQRRVLSLRYRDADDEESKRAMAYVQFQYIQNIPVIFRIIESNKFVDTWKNIFGEWPFPPRIYGGGGVVKSPISEEQMLSLSDDSLIHLLKFYDCYKRNGFQYEHHIGGTDQVISTFSNCCALDPMRFILFFEKFLTTDIRHEYAIAVVEGLAYHIRYRFGNLRPPSKGWEPKKPLPNGHFLGKTIIRLIFQNEFLWSDSYKIARTLKACCHVIEDLGDVELLVFPLFRIANHKNPEEVKQHSFSAQKTGIGPDDLSHDAINSIRGIAAEGSIILATQLLKHGKPLHEMLSPLMHRFAGDFHPGVRAAILNYLPYYSQYDLNGAWTLYDIVFSDPDPLLWPLGEAFLYHNYYNHYDKVKPYLDRFQNEAMETAGETYGRISTLVYLADYICWSDLLDDLNTINNDSVWKGALQVFKANLSSTPSKEKCEEALIYFIDNIKKFPDLLNHMENSFAQLDICGNENATEFAEKYIDALDKKAMCNLYSFYHWFPKLSNNAPGKALNIFERILAKMESPGESGYIVYADELISAAMCILREADLSDDQNFILNAVNI